MTEEEREHFAMVAILTIVIEICDGPDEGIAAVQAALGHLITQCAKNGLPGALSIIKIINDSLVQNAQTHFLKNSEGETLQ